MASRSSVTDTQQGSRTMNRHERRRQARMNRENDFVNDYVKHLPEIGAEQVGKPGRLVHAVYYHDDWCGIYDGNGGMETCTCKPVVKYHTEPRRS